MSGGPRAPIAHLVVLAALAVAFLIGGRVTFRPWGTVAVRPLVGYATLATLVHASSRWITEHALAVRGLAWLIVASMPLHLTTLLRPEVLGPVVALAIVDLARHRAGLQVDGEVPAGTAGKAVAGLSTLAFLAILAVLVPLAKTTGILIRLGLVTATGWALVSLFALRPGTRTPGSLLAGSAAFALTFALLAGPVLPFGPLLTYWATILAVAAAVVTATVSAADEPVREEHRVHEQTVRSLPDPALAPLAERVGEVVAGGDAEAFSRRVEAALDRDEGGRLVAAEARRFEDRGLPEPVARRRALASLLDVEDETGGRP